MKRSLSIVAATALACGLFAALAVVAAAHTARYDSSVTISFQRGHPHGEGDEFSGLVVSQKNRCQIHRTVAVRKRVDGPDPLIGTDLTNKQGRWELKAPGTRAGTYYARAKRKVLRRNANHLHVCRPAISNDLEVHGKP
jgi:hypothetical protein